MTASPENRLAGTRIFRRLEVGLLLAIVVVVIATALLDAQHNYFHFPERSAIDIARRTVMLGIFSLGAGLVIISGGIDLSAGSVIAFSGTVCASLMLLLAPDAMIRAQPLGGGVIAVAIAGTLIVGFLIGSLHAWLITVVRVPPFVATLATLVGLRSLARAICANVTQAVIGGSSTQINIHDATVRSFANSVQIPVAIFVVLALLVWILLSRTVLGRHLYAMGGNEQAARLSGIRTDRMKWFAYCTSAILSSIAGILYISEQSVAEPHSLGIGYELNAIAAAVVGGCSLQGGIGTVPGIVLGALFMRTVIDGIDKIIKTGADVYQGLVVGVVVVLAVAFSQREVSGRRTQFFAGALGVVIIVVLSLLAGIAAALMASANKTSWGAIAAIAALCILGIRKYLERRSSNPGERPV